MSSDPEVTISQGKLCGKFMKSKSGRTFSAFQGIPYAKPPVGDLRFKPPEDPIGWEGTRSAKDEGPRCAQLDYISDMSIIGGDDCLYANVYTPRVERQGKGLNVMVWVHGGGFVFGSGNTDFYGPEYLLDHDIVLVTFNYRVGVLGFLSLGIPEAPGNYGLKDQAAALRWVKNNIEKFGGNPDCVTIFGQSAGGASIHFLLLSHLSRGLFHRAIVQSGTAYDGWAITPDPQNQARKLATKLGCKETTDSALLKFFKNADAKQLMEYETTFTTKSETVPDPTMKFVPCIEPSGTVGAFLTENPQTIMAKGDIANVPVMIGVTTHEGVMSTFAVPKEKQNMQQNVSRCLPDLLGVKEDSPKLKASWTKIQAYFKQKIPDDDAECFTIFLSDVDFNVRTDQLLKQLAVLDRNPVYYYQFSYVGGLSTMEQLHRMKYNGAAHGEELGCLFSRTLLPDELKNASPADHLAIERVTKLWTNFANTADPTPDSSMGVRWEPVAPPMPGSMTVGMRYFDIGKELKMMNGPLNADRMEFWNKLQQECKPKKTQKSSRCFLC